ncbi:MAG: DUF4139 domain-containing protein [Calditrichaeota bacterium]|nr:DUF4139 domain-containing protein [Calditrichota bacterium]
MKKLAFLLLTLIFSLSSVFADDGRKVSVTVYNDNLAVVKDVRMMRFQKGKFELKYQDVAAQIDPTSVHFKSLTAPDKVVIAEQNYDFDLVSSDKILSKYIDENIRVRTKQDSLFAGSLLSYQGNYLILQKPGGAIKMVNRSNVVTIDFPELPEGLLTKPTLLWQIICQQAGAHETEVSYLTKGMEWHAEYIAVAKNNDQNLELNAWVSINNHSGATFPDAKIKLMAGEIHRAEPERRYRQTMDYVEKAMPMAAPKFEEKSFFEYHLYTLDQPSTLKNNQIKQITLFPTVETRCKKIYIFEAKVSTKDVHVNLTFKNEKAAGMGMPLPAGKVRVYKEDPKDQSLELIGEDRIEHTPKDEEVKLYIGNAFDIKVERTMMNKKSTGKRSREETWEVKIRNHKENDNVEVQVVERFYNFWKIKNSTHRYKKLSADKVQFSVPVMRDSEAVLTYTVKLSW